MSARRGRQRSSPAKASRSRNTLDIIDADPVISSIKFGMDSIMKIVDETFPKCPMEDDVKQNMIEKMETSLLMLVEAELTYTQTNTIVNQVVDELQLDANQEMPTREFMASVASVNDVSTRRIADYKKTLTEYVLRAHPTFLRMKSHMDSLVSGDDSSETHNAETETEEVDLEESIDGEQEEVIPELDPITKRPLQDPVRNKTCRHIYGRVAMLELIKKNQRFRCPAMGCNNKSYLRATDLVDDPQLTARFHGGATSSAEASPSHSASKSPAAKRGRSSRRRR